METMIEARCESSDRTISRSLAWLELASIVMSALLIEWVVLPLAGRRSLLMLPPLASLFVLVICSAFWRGENLRALGLRFDNFVPAMRSLLLPMAAGAGLMLASGWWMRAAGYGEPRGWRGVSGVYAWSVVWALAQQYVLQAFVNRRAQIVWGAGRRSVCSVALIFAMLHLPNLPLAIVTFAGGAVWAHVYQRTPNLFALAVSHALMSWVLIACIPASLMNGMRVGYNYFL